MAATFQGQIRVAARIIDYLSSGLYPSPAACLKELINNSYDADATEVSVSVKPDADRIIIHDNGNGMNRLEFQQHFERISESTKRAKSELTSRERPKIGKIGIGFIAANEICEVMEIFSTKRGSRELLHVTIDFSELKKPIEKRRAGDGEIVKADYTGEILTAPPADHYTQLLLTNVRGEARSILAGAQPQRGDATVRSLYGLSPESMYARLTDADLGTWKDFDAYSETMLHVGLNVPVQYFDAWMPGRWSAKVDHFVRAVEELEFHVKYDGIALRKPVVFQSPPNSMFVSTFEFEGQNVAARGYIYAQHGTVRPRELQGLLVRIRHAAVGEYDPQFWGFPASESSLIQRWVSAEIWADDRLEDAMNIDRQTLRVAHPAFAELQAAIHKALRQVFSDARKRLYAKGSDERRAKQAREAKEEVRTTVVSNLKAVAPRLANKVSRQWAESSSPAATKKFSVAELYRIVIEVAQEVLPSDLAKRFIERLTARLLK